MSRILTVKQISNYISGVFEDELILHDICVSAEILEFKTSGSNTFIVLKEDDYILECYKFGKLEQFEKGSRVTVRGKVKYYKKNSKISLIVSEIKYTGEGQHHAEFLKLKQQLSTEGLFENKKTLPVFIKRVAIITSSEGAVIHDFMSVIAKTHAYIAVDLYNVNVQGASAKNEIVTTINFINKQKESLSAEKKNKSTDVIVIARGGGSYQDLLPFNSEEITRAVFGSDIPIITAIGHETDYTLCDFCAALRSPTPSLAAESIAKINQELFNKMYDLLLQQKKLLENKLQQRQNYVSLLTRKLAYKNQLNLQKLENKLTNRLTDIHSRLEKKLDKNEFTVGHRYGQLYSLVRKLLESCERSFSTLNAKLDALSPLKLMAGGYARIRVNSEIIKSINQISENQGIEAVFLDGVATATVTAIKKLNDNKA